MTNYPMINFESFNVKEVIRNGLFLYSKFDESNENGNKDTMNQKVESRITI